MAYKDFAKDAMVLMGVWTISNVIGFLLLPVITKYLGPDGYAIWTQVYVTVTLLTSIVLMGQDMTLLRFFSSQRDKRKISSDFFTLLFFIAIIGFLVATILAVAAGAIAVLLFKDESLTTFVIVASLLIPFSAINMLTTYFFRAAGSVRIYSTLLLANSAGMLALIVLFIEAGFGVMGVVLGNLFTNLACFTASIILILSKIGFSRPQWSLLGPYLRFGLPLTPNSVLRWVTSSSDRYLVVIILNLTLAGIYSAAYSVGAIIFLLVTPLQIVLYPTLSRLYDRGELDEVKSHLSRSLRYYLLFTIPAVAGISILAKPLLVILTSPDFASGSSVIPLVALAGLFSGAFRFVENVTHLVKKTQLNLISFTIPAITDVVLVLILTPLIGITGAALATAISFGIMLIVGSVISSKFIRFSVDWRFVGKSTISAVLLVILIAVINPTNLFGMLISIVLGAAVYFASLIAMRGITREEIGFVRGSINQVVRIVILVLIPRGKR